MGAQLDLFSGTLHAYATGEGVLSNKELYRSVACYADVDPVEACRREPIGQSGELHSTFARKVRWYQQTLKSAGILQRVEGERGVWALTQRAGKDLSKIEPTVTVVGFSTNLGVAILGSCDTVFSSVDSPITLVVTSPPYPLAAQRAYGNPSEAEYVDWICRTIEPVVKNLVPGGSICLNVSNDIFLPNSPARSMYCERLLLALNDRLGLSLLDRIVWANPTKPPGPIQYASKARTQLNAGFEFVYFLSNDPSKVKSDNRRVLQAHTEKHLALIHSGGEKRTSESSDGAYRIRPGSFSNATPGRIPRNVLQFAHRCKAQSAYKRAAAARGLPVHGAPMPARLAAFLIEFLSEPGDLVVDPFSGTFTTAAEAERLGRRWLGTDTMAEFVLGGSTRFEQADGFQLWLPQSMASVANRHELRRAA